MIILKEHSPRSLKGTFKSKFKIDCKFDIEMKPYNRNVKVTLNRKVKPTFKSEFERNFKIEM